MKRVDTQEIFESLTVAAKAAFCEPSSIYKAMKLGCQVAGTYWCDPDVEQYVPVTRPKNRRVITSDGRIYETVTHAAKSLGVRDTSRIYKAIKTGRRYKGCYWSYEHRSDVLDWNRHLGYPEGSV